MQSHKAVSADFLRKHLLPFCFAEQTVVLGTLGNLPFAGKPRIPKKIRSIAVTARVIGLYTPVWVGSARQSEYHEYPKDKFSLDVGRFL